MKNQIKNKIDLKTKPLGSLGKLETLALQIATIQQSLTPMLKKPALVVFGGDHGVANEGVSAYPQDVTHQMVMNFLQGGAAINVFSRQHGFELHIVDAGINFDFPASNHLINHKIAKGTKSFINDYAMSREQFEQCVDKGRHVVKDIASYGSNVIGFGEMGIGNTSSSAIIMSYLCGQSLEDCVGRGTGVDDEQLQNKIQLLQKAKDFHGNIDCPEQICATFAGFEMTQMLGAMLEAYEQNMIILVDGFIASTVFLLASHIQKNIINNAIFCHLSDEKGHRLLLNYLKAEPLLHLDLRLGEGTGCALAYPLIQSAVNFFNDMASFESAGVDEKQ